MSPGPVTSRQHGGHGFGPRFHGHGYGRIAPPVARQPFAQRTAQFAGARQRFSVGGDGKITLDPGENLVVSVGEDGAVTIGVANSEPANGSDAPVANGPPLVGSRGRASQSANRSYAPINRQLGNRPHVKVAVETNDDGSLTLTPEDNEIIVGIDVQVEPLNGEPETTTNGGTSDDEPEPKEASYRGTSRIPQNQKMSVYSGSDGEIVVRPEDDNSLQLIGDPDSGAIAVIELQPMPPLAPGGGNGSNGQ